MTSAILLIAAAYLLGSIPFGLLLARAAGIDLRSVGSGNIGATNVLRTGNKWLAAATLLLDAGKGFAGVWLASRFGAGEPWLPAAAGVAAFLGHVYPVWLGFRGGKGVSTLLGVTLALLPIAALVFGVVWLAVALATRYSSLGGMLAAIAIPVAAVVVGRTDLAAWLTVIVVILLWKHRENIARLRAGNESRIGQKS
ncbi:glycerol-3-phosphate 1-O-acyltransferase PlsY [Sphingosinicellaceae bacterium]|nr:glycerol-3-phosphate 1-O-acyltransferase PlsY [Sphingosinicellaceae bacterium]